MAGHHHVGTESGDLTRDRVCAKMLPLGVKKLDLMPRINQRAADAEQPKGDLVANAA